MHWDNMNSIGKIEDFYRFRMYTSILNITQNKSENCSKIIQKVVPKDNQKNCPKYFAKLLAKKYEIKIPRKMNGKIANVDIKEYQ